MFFTALPRTLRRFLAFGDGIGIEIGSTDLEVAAVRMRPAGIRVTGRLTIRDFLTRSPAEWGAEYQCFLKSLGLAGHSATALLPRRQMIVRVVKLPGVGARDVERALELHVDILHPYGENDVLWGWSSLEGGSILVGIVRRGVVEHYARMFVDAGVATAGFTFSASAIRAARCHGPTVTSSAKGHASDGFVVVSQVPGAGVEVYGESPARPVFSAEMTLPVERAVRLALSEMRLPAATLPHTLMELLPASTSGPGENEPSTNARCYATALSAVCPWLAGPVNVLPPEFRRSNCHRALYPTLGLVGLLLAIFGAMVSYFQWSRFEYQKALAAEIGRLQPIARRASALDHAIEDVRVRIEVLDQFRDQTPADLASLSELTRLINPPAWSSFISLTRDSVDLNVQTPEIEPLLKLLDSSPLFCDTTPDQLSRNNSGIETLEIRMRRRTDE